jgi:transposase-like protein
MIERGGEVVIRMLENVQQVTIEPLIKATIASGSLIYTDEYGIYNALNEWGYEHNTVCHGAGEYARDDDGDGFCEVHVTCVGGLLVTLALLVASPSGHLSGKTTVVLGLLRVCPQRQKERQSFAVCFVRDSSPLTPRNTY